MKYSLEELDKIFNILAHVSSAVIAIVSIYASLSYGRWRREEMIRRRAALAQSCVEHMERFYSRMERLVESQDFMKFDEWGKNFYLTFDEHFKSAQIQADTLASASITRCFRNIEALLKHLPLTRINAAPDAEGTKKEIWQSAAVETQGKIRKIWEDLQVHWNDLKELLNKEALLSP